MFKRLITLVVGSSLICGPSVTSYADSSNPPRVTSVKILNLKSVYQSGDEIVIEIGYSGGNPGLSSASLNPSFLKGGNCIEAIGWNEQAPPYKDYGLNPSNTIRLYSMVTQDCIKGENVFAYRITLRDKTDLQYFQISCDGPSGGGIACPPQQAPLTINVSDGLYVPPGELLPTRQQGASINLSSVADSYIIDELTPTVITFPRRTSDGFLFRYSALGPCNAISDFPGQIPYKISLNGPGQCQIAVLAPTLTRSHYFWNPSGAWKTVELISKSAADRAAAEVKRNYEAAFSTLKTIQISAISWFVEYPEVWQVNPMLKTSLQRAIDYLYVPMPNQGDYDRLRDLLGGTSVSTGLVPDKARAELEITKVITMRAQVAKSSKRLTITCTKGKLTKKFTGINPKCPTGYKKK